MELKVEVVHTRFENKRIDYLVDRKTHLPVRIVVHADGPQRSGLEVKLSKYLNIEALRCRPKRIKR
jgi:hypothetical protein